MWRGTPLFPHPRTLLALPATTIISLIAPASPLRHPSRANLPPKQICTQTTCCSLFSLAMLFISSQLVTLHAGFLIFPPWPTQERLTLVAFLCPGSRPINSIPRYDRGGIDTTLNGAGRCASAARRGSSPLQCVELQGTSAIGAVLSCDTDLFSDALSLPSPTRPWFTTAGLLH